MRSSRHRVTQYILPFDTMIAADNPKQVHVRAWVPLDPGEDWIKATEEARSVDPNLDLSAIPLIGELISSMQDA